MPQNARQKINITPGPEIGNSKAVPQGMGKTADTAYSELSAKLLKIAQEIAGTGTDDGNRCKRLE
jgi:hypothetical protein